MTESAVLIALASVLSLIPLFSMPLGGSVTLVSSLPIIVIAYRRGFGAGAIAAFVFSLIQLLLGLENLSYAADIWAMLAIIFFDYVFPFTALSFAAFFSPSEKKYAAYSIGRKQNSLCMLLASLVPMVLRFLMHLVSGAVVWYSLTKEWYADDPTHIVFKLSPWVYSIVYNISYMLPETLITVVAGVLLAYFLNVKSENLRFAPGQRLIKKKEA